MVLRQRPRPAGQRQPQGAAARLDERHASASVSAAGRSPTEPRRQATPKSRRGCVRRPSVEFLPCVCVSSLRYTTQPASHAPKCSAPDELIQIISVTKYMIFVEQRRDDSCRASRGLQRGCRIERPTRRQHPPPACPVPHSPPPRKNTFHLSADDPPREHLSLVSGTRCQGGPQSAWRGLIREPDGVHEATTPRRPPLGIMHRARPRRAAAQVSAAAGSVAGQVQPGTVMPHGARRAAHLAGNDPP